MPTTIFLPNMTGKTAPLRLSIAEAARHLQALPVPWRIENGQLCGMFKFSNYAHTTAFVCAVMDLAKQQNHHPQVTFGYWQCCVCYVTHSVGGLTTLDFAAAADLSKAAGRIS